MGGASPSETSRKYVYSPGFLIIWGYQGEYTNGVDMKAERDSYYNKFNSAANQFMQ